MKQDVQLNQMIRLRDRPLILLSTVCLAQALGKALSHCQIFSFVPLFSFFKTFLLVHIGSLHLRQLDSILKLVSCQSCSEVIAQRMSASLKMATNEKIFKTRDLLLRFLPQPPWNERKSFELQHAISLCYRNACLFVWFPIQEMLSYEEIDVNIAQATKNQV